MPSGMGLFWPASTSTAAATLYAKTCTLHRANSSTAQQHVLHPVVSSHFCMTPHICVRLCCCVCWGTQVAVICGRNKKLLAELQRTRWPGGSHVVACGFVDNIHEVGASDLLHLSPASSISSPASSS